MALPLTLHHEEEGPIFLDLSDSEDDDILPPPRAPARLQPKEPAEAMRQKTKEAAANVPLHPIPAMQPAFTESLIEATNNTAELKPKLRFGDAKQRRTHLLDGAKGAGLQAELWRYRPGQKHHELWKLLAQISFGVYLLLNGIANSNEQVVTILQGHIDEVDEFLETTLEDLNLAVQDVQERIDFLRLPMENIATFEQMLEDRNFRLQIVNGNEKIEHIVERTTTALEATLKDVDEGLRATKEFAIYLGDQQERAWRQQRPELGEIYDAMKGNAQGWYKAFIDLQDSGSALDTLLIRLGQTVAEMDQRAGEVSRRTRFSVAPCSGPPGHPRDDSMASSPRSSSRRPSAPQSPRSTSQRSQPSSPPPREPARLLKQQRSQPRMLDPKDDRIRESVVRVEEDAKPAQEPRKPAGDEVLFLLQPRTYTPQPPEPVPSPRDQDAPPPKQERQEIQEIREEGQPKKRTSLRQRVSLKGGNLPEVIQVPPRNAPELERLRYQSPRHLSARNNQAPDSASGSDIETRQPFQSVVDPVADMSPPRFPNSTIPSPRSDQQYFYPVRASPHSPLQQRPWTSATATRPHTSHTSHTAHPGHLRNQPSAMGMSMLSNVTTMTQGGTKTVKKKRSAFGWLKKAFTLDEEERAEYEARRQQQAPNPYYEGRSPKFLDGKRVEEYKRYQ
ncbi:Uu.00g027940.m01.CDS01 [Anthostomella pinea]|uniref:Uu.00g027940.m01.CDS01 n=1 Tax=Anthostomella pinea TaxID=933095 RepID=A0AAI8V7U1_9PEZI|nr:Uu.00g027940.m01.CDS01 [Anthostomella pinea]